MGTPLCSLAGGQLSLQQTLVWHPEYTAQLSAMASVEQTNEDGYQGVGRYIADGELVKTLNVSGASRTAKVVGVETRFLTGAEVTDLVSIKQWAENKHPAICLRILTILFHISEFLFVYVFLCVLGSQNMPTQGKFTSMSKY